MSDIFSVETKPYHFIINNMDNSLKTVVLFGYKYFAKTINYGSEIGAFVKSADPNVEILDLLKQSDNNEFEAKGIRIITDNWKNMPKSIYYKNLDTGAYHSISLVNAETWGKFTVLERAVNDIHLPNLLIKGSTKFILTLEPNSELEVLFY